MRPFRYIFDPLFVLTLVVYPLNRWIVKPYFPNTFSSAWLNDLICIPFLIPIMLGLMRLLRLRRHDNPPQSHEVLLPLIIWTVYFEIYLPSTQRFKGIAFGDPFDIFFYTLGALTAILFWHWHYRPHPAEAQ